MGLGPTSRDSSSVNNYWHDAPPNSMTGAIEATSCCCRIQRLREVADNIVNVLDPHTEPKHLWGHPGFELFLRRELPVRCGRWMTCQRLGVAHVDHSFEQAQGIETLPARLEATFYSKRQQGAAPRAQVFLREWIQRIIWKSRVIDPIHHAVGVQILRHLSGVLHMTLDTEGQRLNPLKQQEAVQGRQSGAGVALKNRPTPRDVGSFAVMFRVHHAVIGDLRAV